MVSFMTEFPIDHAHVSSDFLRLIENWILGSPRTSFGKEELAGIFEGSESKTHKVNEAIEALRFASGEEERAGIRYLMRDEGLVWVTTMVFSRARRDSWVGIKVSCESGNPAVRLPPAEKPVLVSTILRGLGGASDGALHVGESCVWLRNSDIDLAARLIGGQAGCHLPIVYVSSGFEGSYSVEPDRLARELAGMAHIVVEPNRPFSYRLKIEAASQNVYGGTVGVYWPDGGGRRLFFLGREHETPAELENAVFQEIRAALVNRRGLERCTWVSLQETASRQATQALRASGSTEVDKYIETFDKELAAKSELLEAAEREIVRLQNELLTGQVRPPSKTGVLLHPGREEDFYQNESANIVRDAIEDATRHVPADSRRQHVLAAILDANPPEEDIAGSMREQLKHLLRTSQGMDAKTRHGLEQMGFEITEDGKHYKLVFQGDDRYTFTLPKSGSDHRGGLNAASDIGRLLF